MEREEVEEREEVYRIDLILKPSKSNKEVSERKIYSFRRRTRAVEAKQKQ